MKKNQLGCLNLSGILAALGALVAVIVITLLRGGILFSPGDLNAQQGEAYLRGVYSHAELSGRCEACHTAPWDAQRMADRCLDCHHLVIEDPKDFHRAMLGQGLLNGCYTCHTEHRGPDGALTLEELVGFPHENVGFSLFAHQQHANGAGFVCRDCHTETITQLDPAVCETCHRLLDGAFLQGHVATFGGDCLACHDGVDTYGANFDHGQVAFALIGKHIPLACGECHAQARSVADLQAVPQDCYTCHAADDPHAGRLGQNCATCHTPDGWETTQIDHSLTTFPLTGLHVSVDCENCHVAGLYQGTPADCYACHSQDDAHDGQFGQSCGDCHIPDGWEDASIDHSLTAFPLTGLHVSVACESCHASGVFKGTPADCYACHSQDDAHDGQFGQSCGDCHTPDGWEDASIDHSLTAFPLTGLHVSVACESCHASGVFKGTPAVCSGCHAEPDYHQGVLGVACADCHSTSAWSPASYSGLHTFPMNHGDTGNSCRTCHPSSLGAYTCYGCHDANDVTEEHQDEGISNFQDCMRCHPTGQEGEGDD